MALIPRVFVPADLSANPAAGISTPISRISLTYLPPGGQTVTVAQTLVVLVNGVDLFAVLGGQPITAESTFLPRALWQGNYLICVAQGVTHAGAPNASQFSTGAIFPAAANWRGPLPIAQDVYRKHGLNFPTAFEFLHQKMDPIWRRHEDVRVIAQIESVLRQAAESETIRMVNTRNTSYVEWVEPLDRTDGVVVTVDGALSVGVVPFVDIEVLYRLSANSRAFVYGLDFFVNSSGRLVFTCGDAPGRVGGAVSALLDAEPARPAGPFVPGTRFTITSPDPVALFAQEGAGLLTGFDFFIRPPRVPDAAGYAPADGSDKVGKVIAYVPRTGEMITLHDPDTGADVFSGSVQLQTPVDLGVADFIKIYQVRAPSVTDANFVQHPDANPPINMVVWLNRSVTLVGPHAHIAAGRLNYLWTQIVGGTIGSTRLVDRLEIAAGMAARTEKSLQSFATYVEALLAMPLGPFKTGYVTRITQPDPGGIVNGQINVFGAVQEFDRPITLAVSEGDKVSFLQSLVGAADRVTVHDAFTDSDFLQYASDGAPPASDPTSIAYVRSKIVAPIVLPGDFVSQFPTGSPFFFAAEILKSKSFRIDLGVYASQRFLADPGATDRLFAAIDAVKPSGTDYWFRLSDGTPIVRNTGLSRVLDISANLDLPTDFAQRIFTDAAFASSQYHAFHVYPRPGDDLRVDQVFRLSLSAGAYTNDQTLSETDFAANPLHPMDALLQRWADGVNATFVAPGSRLIASVVGHRLRILVFPAFGDYGTFLYTSPLTGFAQQVGGPGLVVMIPAAAALVPPPDASVAWQSQADAVGTINSFAELLIASGPSFANVRDFGAGPYDANGATIAPAATNTYVSQPVAVLPPGGGKAARIKVEGYMYSVGGDFDGRVEFGLAAGTPDVGSGVKLTVSHTDPDILPVPLVLTRAYRADDIDPTCLILGLARPVMEDSTLSQYFKAVYPTTVGAHLALNALVPDDAAGLSGFTFTIEEDAGGAPWLVAGNFFVGNSAGTGGGVGPQSISPIPTVPPGIIFTPTWGGITPIPASRTVSAYAPAQDGGGNRFVVEWTFFPTTHPGLLAVSVDVNNSSAGPTARPLFLQNLRVVVNDYPEYSRDADAIIMGSAMVVSARGGTFTYDVAAGNPPAQPVPTPVPTSYYRKRESTVDVTPRMIAPSQALISLHDEDFGFTEIYLLDTGGASRTILQNKDPGNVPVTINSVRTTIVLYKKNVDGSYTLLVEGTDYTVNGVAPAAATSVTTIALPTNAVIVGFAQSVLYDYYFEGPNAVLYRRTIRSNPAPGIRALYDEPLPAPPNTFRQNNANNDPVDGPPIAAPYDVAAYLASGVRRNPAFGADTNTLRVLPVDPIIVRKLP